MGREEPAQAGSKGTYLGRIDFYCRLKILRWHTGSMVMEETQEGIYSYKFRKILRVGFMIQNSGERFEVHILRLQGQVSGREGLP